MKTLNRRRILITRPAHQAEKLAQEIQRYHGVPIYFPTLEIVSLDNAARVDHALKKLTDDDFILFVSPNAVFNAKRLIYAIEKLLTFKKINIVAIGPGTVEALKHYHLSADYYPEKTFSSEGLLVLSALQAPIKKQILIIKGKGGRLHLSKTLKKRGAQVSLLNVYQRQLPATPPTIPDVKTVDIILCTSRAGLHNLIHLVYPTWGKILFQRQLLVISPRLADYAKKRGFVKTSLISDNASNEAILQTLLAWQEKCYLWQKNPSNPPTH